MGSGDMRISGLKGKAESGCFEADEGQEKVSSGLAPTTWRLQTGRETLPHSTQREEEKEHFTRQIQKGRQSTTLQEGAIWQKSRRLFVSSNDISLILGVTRKKSTDVLEYHFGGLDSHFVLVSQKCNVLAL